MIDVLGDSGNSLGAGPTFGLNAAPVVAQAQDSTPANITGAYGVTLVGLAGDGGSFLLGSNRHFTVLMQATVGGQVIDFTVCAEVTPVGAGPSVETC